MSHYDTNLEKNKANHVPLTPLTFLKRAKEIYPNYEAIIYEDRKYTWSDVYKRCNKFASALEKIGIGKGDTVSFLAFNSQEIMIFIKLSEWPNIIRQATRYQEPHRISYYLYELSSLFHSLYQSGDKGDPYRFIMVENKVLSLQRLCLAKTFSNLRIRCLYLFHHLHNHEVR